MSSMATFAGEVSVFADTNLGTRISFNVPQDITAGAFKRDFERVHFSCLPHSGKIQVDGLMVKRRLFFYYLPDSLPLKYVFPGMSCEWFLHVEASHLKNFCVSHPEAATTAHFRSQDLISCSSGDKARGNSEDNTVHILKKKKKKRRKFNKKNLQDTASAMPEGCSCKFEENPMGINEKNPVVIPENEDQISVKPNANSMQGSLSEMSTEVLSVTGIIDKYFPTGNRIDNLLGSPSLSDVTSNAVHEDVDDQPKTIKTPLNVLRAPLHVGSVSRTSQDKRRESKLRKRLVAASLSLGISPIKQSPTLSLCRLKDEKLSQHKSETIGSLFNISDNDD